MLASDHAIRHPAAPTLDVRVLARRRRTLMEPNTVDASQSERGCPGRVRLGDDQLLPD